jgi:hypothetical protein
MTDRPAPELHGLDDSDLQRIEIELTRRFCPPLPTAVVQECVIESAAHFERAPVRTYLAILVERRAAARLRELVAGHGDAAEPDPRAPDEVPRGYVGPSVRAS